MTNRTEPATSTCSATWPDSSSGTGVCNRPVYAKHLCAGHYNHQRQGKPFAPLRGPHGADVRNLVAVKLHLPRADVNAIAAEAQRTGRPEPELYRSAVFGYATKLRKGAQSRTK